jgi:hypothetical protein
MVIKIKKDLKGSKGSLLIADKTAYGVIEIDLKKKRYLIEVSSKSWFIDFKQAEVI